MKPRPDETNIRWTQFRFMDRPKLGYRFTDHDSGFIFVTRTAAKVQSTKRGRLWLAMCEPIASLQAH